MLAALDRGIQGLVRRTVRRSEISKQDPAGLRLLKAYVTLVWLGLGAICVETTGFVYCIVKILRTDAPAEAFEGPLFSIFAMSDTLVLTALLLLLLAVGTLVAIQHTVRLRWDGHWVLALAITLTIAIYPLRRVGIRLVGERLYNHASVLASSEAGKREALTYTSWLNDSVGPGDLEAESLSLSSRIQLQQGNSLPGVLLAARLLTHYPDSSLATEARRTLDAGMFLVGSEHSVEYCVRLYESVLAKLPDPAISPFRFFTKVDWSVIDDSWESSLFNSEPSNTKLRALLGRFPEHPDVPYIRYLLGDVAYLKSHAPNSSAGWLAMYHEAREAQQHRGDMMTALANYQLIVASKSAQSFVDDAAFHGSRLLAAFGRKTEAVTLLLRGYGRGNRDQNREIESELIAILRSLDEPERLKSLDGSGDAPISKSLHAFGYGVSLALAMSEGTVSDMIAALRSRAQMALTAAYSEGTSPEWSSAYGTAIAELGLLTAQKSGSAISPVELIRVVRQDNEVARALWVGPSGIDYLDGHADGVYIEGAYNALDTAYGLSSGGANRGDSESAQDKLPPGATDRSGLMNALRQLQQMADKGGAEDVCGKCLTAQYRILRGDLESSSDAVLHQAQALEILSQVAFRGDLESATRMSLDLLSAPLTPEIQREVCLIQANVLRTYAYANVGSPQIFGEYSSRALACLKSIVDAGQGSRIWLDALHQMAAVQEDMEVGRGGVVPLATRPVPGHLKDSLRRYLAARDKSVTQEMKRKL
jgi:hypothetical protein